MTPETASRRPLRIGLTGGIGSGKSTVARLLAARGAHVIDADALAAAATRDPAVLERVALTFGPGVVGADGLDRAALAELVFGDAEARRALEAIVHPWVRAAAAEREAALARRGASVVVHDVPLLFETGLDASMDATVVVSAPLELRIARVALRDGRAAAAVRARDAAQLPLDEKASRATFVIDNGGPPESLDAQVDALWRSLAVLRSERRGRSGRGSRCET